MPTSNLVMPVNRLEANGHTSALYSQDRLLIKVVGVSPLLCANPSSMQPETDAAPRTKTTKSKKPEDVCREAAYIDAEGHCCFPNKALFAAILSASELMKLKIGAGRYPTKASTIIQAGLSFDWTVSLTKLLNPKTGKPLTPDDYEIDMHRAVNQNTGGAIIAIRPRFDAWSAVFHFLVDTQNADCMALVRDYFPDILKYAGMSVGLGAYRAYIEPKGKGKKKGAGGPYGKFGATIVD
jgi:hypothetical protein